MLSFAIKRTNQNYLAAYRRVRLSRPKQLNKGNFVEFANAKFHKLAEAVIIHSQTRFPLLLILSCIQFEWIIWRSKDILLFMEKFSHHFLVIQLFSVNVWIFASFFKFIIFINFAGICRVKYTLWQFYNLF